MQVSRANLTKAVNKYVIENIFTENERQVYEMSNNGMTYSQIADAMNFTKSNVSITLTRARNKLYTKSKELIYAIDEINNLINQKN